MKTVIISCETIRNELLCALQDAHMELTIIWLESGLHNTPKILNKRLGEVLRQAEAEGAERVLIAMGFCGNSFPGLETGKVEVVIPRVDDCITLLLGSLKRRKEISETQAAYFLTQGWMRGERNIWVEHQYAVEKYGEEAAMEMAEMMYSHYRTLALLDSQSEPIEPLIEDSKIIAETLGLEQKVFPASRDYIVELLKGPWPEERFAVIAPGSTIQPSDLQLPAV